MARLGTAWQGKARLGMARHGSAWLGKARQGEARQGSAWRGSARQGKARISFSSRDRHDRRFNAAVVSTRCIYVTAWHLLKHDT